MDYDRNPAGNANARTATREMPSIIGMVTGQISDGRLINRRLTAILEGLRVSPPHEISDTAPEPDRTLVNAVATVGCTQVETLGLLSEIERFI